MITIYKSDGTVRTTAHKIKREGTFLNVATLTVTISSSEVINFDVGDYADYYGMRYYVYFPCIPTKQATSGAYGESFKYEQELKCATYDLNCIFRDLVPADNSSHFTSLPDVSTYEDVHGIAGRIQENMDASSSGHKWNIEVVTTNDADLNALLNEVKEFTVSNGTCLDALQKIYDQWEKTGWIYSYNSSTDTHTITIGKPSIAGADNTTDVFRYGRGNGFRTIKGEISNKDDFATRIYPYGNTTNMPSRYYNRIEAVEDSGVMLVGESAYIPNLMLPSSHWLTTVWYKWMNGTVAVYTKVNSDLAGATAYESPNVGAKVKGTITAGTASSSITVGGVTYAYNSSAAWPDASKAYLQNDSMVAKYGIREKCIYFNGSDDYDDIHPSIKELTIGDVRDAMESTVPYYPSSVYTDSERIDMVKSCTNPIDDGTLSESGGKRKEETVSGSLTHASSMLVEKDDDTGRFNVFGDNGDQICFITNTITGECTITFASSGYVSPVVSILFGSDFQLAGGTDSYEVPLKVMTGTDVLYSDFITAEVVAVSGRNELAIDLSSLSISVDNVESSPITIVLGQFQVISTYSGSSVTATVSAGGTASAYIKLILASRFKIRLKQIGFDISEQTSISSEWAINVNSGDCAGRSFGFLDSSVKYIQASDEWEIECYRQTDSDLNMLFPNSAYQIKAGDIFVLSGFEMPDIYVEAKSQQLYTKAVKALADLSSPGVQYTPEIDSHYMMAHKDDASFLMPYEGMYLKMQDTEMTSGGQTDILIDTFSISEDGDALPKFSVTLKEKKSENIITRLFRQSTKNTAAISRAKVESSRYDDIEEGGMEYSTYNKLSQMKDVNMSALANGVVLQYNAAIGKWICVEMSGGSEGAVMYSEEQSLTDTQKSLARKNQGLYYDEAETEDEVEYDGTKTGKTIILTNYVKVSDTVPTQAQLVGSTVEYDYEGEAYSGTILDGDVQDETTLGFSEGAAVYVKREGEDGDWCEIVAVPADTTVSGATIGKGLYFSHYSGDTEDYVTSLIYDSPIPTGATIVHKIDNKYVNAHTLYVNFEYDSTTEEWSLADLTYADILSAYNNGWTIIGVIDDILSLLYAFIEDETSDFFIFSYTEFFDSKLFYVYDDNSIETEPNFTVQDNVLLVTNTSGGVITVRQSLEDISYALYSGAQLMLRDPADDNYGPNIPLVAVNDYGAELVFMLSDGEYETKAVATYDSTTQKYVVTRTHTAVSTGTVPIVTTEPQVYLPNIHYQLDWSSLVAGATKTIPLNTTYTGNWLRYYIGLDLGANVPTITWPATVVWKKQPSFSANKHYEVLINGLYADYREYPEDSVVVDDGNYITFSSTSNTIALSNKGGNSPTVQYSTDKTNWSALSTTPISFTGDIYVRGSNPNGFSTSASKYSSFVFGNSNPVYCKGNVMKLIDYSSEITAIPCDYCFYYLFKNCTALTTSPELPATTLMDSCYKNMFYGSGIVEAPSILPARTLTEECYAWMFYNCSYLTVPPVINAVTLAKSCCSGMFFYCTSLIKSPALFASTLAEGCYNSMFAGCLSLANAGYIYATVAAKNSCRQMFMACYSLRTPPMFSFTTLAESCCEGMFNLCSNMDGIIIDLIYSTTALAKNCFKSMFSESGIEKAPSLPVATLAEGCYYEMFKNCSRLKEIKMLATDISATDCLTNWVSGVASSGTFTKSSSMTTLPTGASGIPSGWTVVDE